MFEPLRGTEWPLTKAETELLCAAVDGDLDAVEQALADSSRLECRDEASTTSFLAK